MKMLKTMILLSILLSTGCALTAPLCNPTAVVFRGTDLIKVAKGQLVLISFMPLQCRRCRTQLERLSSLAAEYKMRIAVLTPHWETYSVIKRIQDEFNKLLIDKDTDSSYQRLGVLEHEIAIFDKCGRLARVIAADRSDLSQFSDTADALRSAQSHAICGWCKFTNAFATSKKVDVWIARSPSSKHRPTKRPQDPSRKAVQPTVLLPPESANYAESRARNDGYRKMRPTVLSDKANGTPDYGEVVTPMDYDEHGGHQTNIKPQTEAKTWGKPTAEKTGSKLAKSSKLPKFSQGDYDYYLDESSMPTAAPAPQTQIPTPSLPSWWSAQPPTVAHPQTQTPLAEENIPCSAYTDDVCFHQQEKVGTEGLSKCCTKKIYFTDLCVPGKCSNSTAQLCCMQKFLQAKYACCNDETQGDDFTPTDKFSKCCYELFSMEDDCCPTSTAKAYWDSANELCLPNTKMHLDKTKFEVRFAEGIRVVDLGQNRLWDHNCSHGGNRQQFAYVP